MKQITCGNDIIYIEDGKYLLNEKEIELNNKGEITFDKGTKILTDEESICSKNTFTVLGIILEKNKKI